MRTKRLLCVFAALALLLTVPARAAEDTDIAEGTTEISGQEVPLDPAPVTPEETETPEIPGETPENPETPEDPENPVNPVNPVNPENPENPEPSGTPEVPENPEAPPEEEAEPPAEDEPAEEAPTDEEEPAPQAEPVINVVLPTSARVVVNPYGLAVNMDGVSSTDQIVGAAMPIVSYSSVPVAVMASAAGQPDPGSEVVFVNAPPAEGAWEKELFLFAEFQNALDQYGSAFWSGTYTGAPNQLPVTGGAPMQVLTLVAGDVTPSYGAFRLFGAAATAPANPWSAEDTINVTLTFTFVPLA